MARFLIRLLKSLVMADQNNSKQNQEQNSNAIKDPDKWTTGGEPMTGAQKSYLNTLSTEAGEEVEEDLTKAEASKKINELQQETGRGLDNNQNQSSK